MRGGLLLFVVVFFVVQCSAARMKSQSALLVLVYDECLAVCDDAIKQEDACPEFCDFVNHLYNHDPTIFQTLTTHYRQDIDVIRWALQELTKWKMNTKTDDLHETSMKFRDLLLKWGEYKVQYKATFGEE
uniref:Uncharacterized protein n=1 Tax=Vannella robusta TaxID=1487602 RepID=A0A7S4MNI2_9EUKA|mmetsp:Transcript_454/g.607  ORF Transcript_454/g.607 Transcript_454/m.607 type:complete len:130 (+) Transcript_454:29-418(+)